MGQQGSNTTFRVGGTARQAGGNWTGRFENPEGLNAWHSMYGSRLEPGDTVTVGDAILKWNGSAYKVIDGDFVDGPTASAWAAKFSPALAAGSTATIAGVPSVYRGPGVGWVATGATRLSRYLRVATFGDSTADISAGQLANTEKQIFPFPTGSRGYAFDSSKATLINHMRCLYVGGGGIGGQVTQQFLDRGKNAYSTTRKAMQDILATLPDVVQMHGGSINDYSSFTASTPQATIDAVVARHVACVEFFTSAGVLVVDTGTMGYSVPGANLSAICKIIVDTNKTLAGLAASNPLWKFIDPANVTHDGTGLYIPAMTSDNVHLSSLGALTIGEREAQAVAEHFVSGCQYIVAKDSQDWFASVTANNPPTNFSPGYNAGKTTVNSFVTKPQKFTADLTLSTSDTFLIYIGSLPTTLFAGCLANDLLLFEYQITVRDYATGVIIPCVECTRFTLKDFSNTNTLIYEAASAMIIGNKKSLQFALPVDASSINVASQVWLGASLPGAGRYLIEYAPVRLRKYTSMT